MKTDRNKIIEECNQECQACREDFEKAGIFFTHTMCAGCSNGHKLHNALCRVSPAEEAWGKLAWNSSKYEDLYHG